MTEQDDMSLVTVAIRLGRSSEWVRRRLAADRSLHVHHYIGRSPRWTEAAYQALRAAIIDEDTLAAEERARRAKPKRIRLRIVPPDTPERAG